VRVDHLDVLGGDTRGDVAGLRAGQVGDPLVQPRGVDGGPAAGVIALEVSMSDLEGTQSVSTQAPPSPSESTTVTSAPSWAATRAAS